MQKKWQDRLIVVGFAAAVAVVVGLFLAQILWDGAAPVSTSGLGESPAPLTLSGRNEPDVPLGLSEYAKREMAEKALGLVQVWEQSTNVLRGTTWESVILVQYPPEIRSAPSRRS